MLFTRPTTFPNSPGGSAHACEKACVLGINEPAGDDQEHRAVDHRTRGLMPAGSKPQPPGERTGKKVAVVGTGPAGIRPPRPIQSRRVTPSPSSSGPIALVGC